MKYFNKETLDIITETLSKEYLDYCLINYHNKFYELFNLCDLELYDIMNKKTFGPLQYVSISYTNEIVKEYFKSLPGKYFYKLLYDMKTNKIEYWDKNVGNFNMEVGGRKYKFHIPKSNTLWDSFSLVHEFTHRLVADYPRRNYLTFSHEVYAEMLCILSELKFFDFLKDNNILVSDMLIVKDIRKQSFKEEMSSFMFLEPLLSKFLKNKKITPTSVNQLLGMPYYEDYSNVYNELEKLKQKPQNIIDFLDYTHPYGTIFASYLHQLGITDKEFIYLIKYVNRMELNEFNKLLPNSSYLGLVDKVKKEFSLEKIKK